jgi:hypothetical protein
LLKHGSNAPKRHQRDRINGSFVAPRAEYLRGNPVQPIGSTAAALNGTTACARLPRALEPAATLFIDPAAHVHEIHLVFERTGTLSIAAVFHDFLVPFFAALFVIAGDEAQSKRQQREERTKSHCTLLSWWATVAARPAAAWFTGNPICKSMDL